jgi:2-amino-4-hydroxy-6-hydroxymethyldihydropteridine diphosphokinase
MSVAPTWWPVYVGIGSNQDGPAHQVERAFDACERLPRSRLVARSRKYASAPFGPVTQDEFVNAVAGLLSQLSPEELLAALQQQETELGRASPRERWGPRRIDLDLLVYGRETRATDALLLPHPGIAERDFVLYPLHDVAPDLDVPGVGRVSALRAKVADRGMRLLEPRSGMVS